MVCLAQDKCLANSLKFIPQMSILLYQAWAGLWDAENKIYPCPGEVRNVISHSEESDRRTDQR